MIRKLITIVGTLGIIFGFGLLIAIMAAARPKVAPVEPAITPPTVFYTVAEARSVTLDVAAQGEVKPRTDITLTSQVSGKIVSTGPAFVDGGAFDKGDLLVKIEDADYRFAVTSAKARVAQALEALKMEEAESTLAEKDYQELGRKTDPSDLALRRPQLAQARAVYAAAKADEAAAELNLERTSVRAPFKGRVRQRLAGDGQYVAPGSQLGRIFSTDVAEVKLALTDNDLAQLGLPLAFAESKEHPGPPVLLSATIAGETHHWAGRIARTEGAIDPSTRQVFAIAVVDDPYGAGSDGGVPLAVGLYVDAQIQGKPYKNAIVLPRSSLYGRNVVYVIKDDDTLSKRTVRVIASARDTVTIADGVSPGEKVATSPLRGADDGDKVTPTDPNAADPDRNEEPSPMTETASVGDKL